MPLTETANDTAEEVLAAGTRAAELVSQLLTFSRRQMIKPRALEVNQLVRGVEAKSRRREILRQHDPARAGVPLRVRTLLLRGNPRPRDDASRVFENAEYVADRTVPDSPKCSY